MIDLRSDTATRPTPGMRAAMAAAEVGDDVQREDPTVNRLEERVAALLGHEAALFVPSGTMSNQIGVKAHTVPGDEMLIESTAHVYNYEAGGPAVLSGVMCRTIDGDCGVLDVKQLEGKIRAANDHFVRTRIVALENTCNRGGGRVFPLEKIRPIRAWTKQHGLILHLDGARLWNASVATGTPMATWGAEFDSVSVCFSKGMGAPVGSALCGPKDFITKGRRIRKLFGGGMRQAGVLAAAALYALDHNFERLAEDHANAQVIAEAIRECPTLRLVPERVETNLVWFEAPNAADLARGLKEDGILVQVAGATTLRACLHLDVSAAQAKAVADSLRRRFGRQRASA